VRVIAGYLGGRQFESPGTAQTHPMSDKIRGALFNILGDIEGLSILDAFAGSGAIGFEALSRGALAAVAIESDRAAQQSIARSISLLGLDSTMQLICASAQAWLDRNHEASFDLVVCDPPYNDLQPQLLQRLATVVKPGGLLVLSWPASQPPPALGHLEMIDQRHYGDAQLFFYRKSQGILPGQMSAK
jgi:16S rRNA (guanine966-N2)-methyltransferase